MVLCIRRRGDSEITQFRVHIEDISNLNIGSGANPGLALIVDAYGDDIETTDPFGARSKGQPGCSRLDRPNGWCVVGSSFREQRDGGAVGKSYIGRFEHFCVFCRRAILSAIDRNCSDPVEKPTKTRSVPQGRLGQEPRAGLEQHEK